MSTTPSSRPVCPGRLRRTIFVIAGSLFLAIGLVGIVIPVLPTTPLLIVAAIFYARGSSRCYSWLVSNRLFGRYLDDYLHGRGISWKVKASTLVLLWGVITCTAILLVQVLWLRVLLFVIAVAVTAHVLTLKGRRRSGSPSSS